MKEHQVYLQHIIDAIQKIESYVSVVKDVFLSTSHWQDATIRQLEIIGEATKQLPEDFRSKYPNIPWKRIAGLRDVLIHNYLGTDITTVCEITQKNIPELKKQIQNILHLFE